MNRITYLARAHALLEKYGIKRAPDDDPIQRVGAIVRVGLPMQPPALKAAEPDPPSTPGNRDIESSEE